MTYETKAMIPYKRSYVVKSEQKSIENCMREESNALVVYNSQKEEDSDKMIPESEFSGLFSVTKYLDLVEGNCNENSLTSVVNWMNIAETYLEKGFGYKAERKRFERIISLNYEKWYNQLISQAITQAKNGSILTRSTIDTAREIGEKIEKFEEEKLSILLQTSYQNQLSEVKRDIKNHVEKGEKDMVKMNYNILIFCCSALKIDHLTFRNEFFQIESVLTDKEKYDLFKRIDKKSDIDSSSEKKSLWDKVKNLF